MQKHSVSIVIPTYNEEGNIVELIHRIHVALTPRNIAYEVIAVDDHSTDKTPKILELVSQYYPVKLLIKKGKKGKSQSLIEGFSEAKNELICMIDGDLQYPPEAIPQMIEKVTEGADIVVARRQSRRGPKLRRSLSKTFTFVFGRMFLGLGVDVQSGLKLFKRQVLDTMTLQPSPWGFDYEFLSKAKRMKWQIDEVDIRFSRRLYGVSSVNILTAFELALGVLKLKSQQFVKTVFKFLDHPHSSERLGPQFEKTDNFLFLPEIFSTKKHIYTETAALLFFGSIVVSALLLGLKSLSFAPLVVISALIAFFYLFFMIFKLVVIYNALRRPLITLSDLELEAINEEKLPTYTIIIPLYQEAAVIPQILKAMTAIDYPKDKLDIIITLEEYDYETMAAIRRANMPSYFKTLILPNVEPKTKPKALNVAFLQTKGEFVVIYDAEIIPDTDQLKKAVLAFRKYPHISCLQPRLDHYNANKNILTRLFNAEFSFYYDLFLPGLQRLGYPIPLSGHSTHFRREVIEKVGAWDPYNVAEDCDMGIRLHRNGFRTDIFDSISREEAISSVIPWIKQRTRWMKGFIQTSIVHLRHPFRFIEEIGGLGNFFGFFFTVPGTVAINVLNLFYWFLIAAWITTRSPWIQTLFPGPILYISVISFILGNAIFTFLNLIGLYQRKRFALVKYCLLSPIYWFLLAIATTRAVLQVIIKPHHWEKTMHGEPETVEKAERRDYVLQPA